jgi:hypothetical protein
LPSDIPPLNAEGGKDCDCLWQEPEHLRLKNEAPSYVSSVDEKKGRQ